MSNPQPAESYLRTADPRDNLPTHYVARTTALYTGLLVGLWGGAFYGDLPEPWGAVLAVAGLLAFAKAGPYLGDSYNRLNLWRLTRKYEADR